MFKCESYEVYSDQKKIGYLDRQGEDGRLMDSDRYEKIQNFFPWGKALDWVKKNGYSLKRIE